MNRPRSIPVKKILASAVSFALALSLTALPAFADDNTIEVSTGAELDAALKSAASGSIISLASDIDAVSSATYSGKTLTIEGNGHSINGGGADKTAIRFTGTSAVTFRNLTLQNLASALRYGGGAIGVYRGTLTVEGCTFIANQATNATGDGGALLLDSSSGGGSIRVTNSTFFGNTSGRDGGAISSAAKGEIVNCTIVGNTAKGKGGGFSNGTATAANQASVYNSILIGNTASSDTAGHDIFRMAADGGCNVVGVFTNSENESWTPAASTVTNISSDGWLAAAPSDNGGPTKTIALLSSENSPAIDKADADMSPALDQRGVSRDETPDIGAFELSKTLPLSVKPSVKKIVAGYSASLPVEVAFTAEPFAVELGLYAPDGALISSLSAASDGKYLFMLKADQASAGTYAVKASDTSAVLAQAKVECVAAPTGLWAPIATVNEGGTVITFASAVSFNESRKSVKIGAAAIDGDKVTASGSTVTISSAVAEEGQKIVLSGVKYADLFPSYSFTFTVTMSAVTA